MKWSLLICKYYEISHASLVIFFKHFERYFDGRLFFLWISINLLFSRNSLILKPEIIDSLVSTLIRHKIWCSHFRFAFKPELALSALWINEILWGNWSLWYPPRICAVWMNMFKLLKWFQWMRYLFPLYLWS